MCIRDRYLPFPKIFGYLGELTAQSGQFTPGAKHNVLSVPDTKGMAGVFICYESIFPNITRGLVLDGANFLINTTNDAWFGQTAAPEQHFAMSVIRAIETRRAVVRAANTGISGIISPYGQITSSTDLEETEIFTQKIELRSDKNQMIPEITVNDTVFFHNEDGSHFTEEDLNSLLPDSKELNYWELKKLSSKRPEEIKL